MLAFGREVSNTFISIRLVTVPAATPHVAGLSHVVLCVSVFCGDGKVGTGGSGQQGREMLSLQAPPPRPRPSSVPMRPLHSSGEHNESRFEQPVVRDRRRRAHSRSVSRHRHRRARSPRRKRRTRTPAQSRQAGPLEPNPGSDGSATTASFTSPTLHATAQARAYVRSARMVSSAMQWPAAPFPPHPQPQQFTRPSDAQPEQRPPMQGSQAPQPDTDTTSAQNGRPSAGVEAGRKRPIFFSATTSSNCEQSSVGTGCKVI